MGKVRLYLDFDWAAADTEFRQAQTLAPHDVSVLMWAGIYADSLGHSNDALQLYEQCLAIDPLNLRVLWLVAGEYAATGRTAEAEKLNREISVLSPTSPSVHAATGRILVEAGQADAGIAEIEREQDRESRDMALASVYQILGRRVEADAALARLKLKYAAKYPYLIASLHAQRGDLDQAFEWLDRALQQRDRAVVDAVASDPRWNNLRGDQRFKTFLRKLKFPE
ncbi:MAG TPA: tetratricopeptide repeat protein [Steroidobacteraceae bacterium]|nr:tetratricopeptide repeat protein [Steroidobacteraceae bacterium]